MLINLISWLFELKLFAYKTMKMMKEKEKKLKIGCEKINNNTDNNDVK